MTSFSASAVSTNCPQVSSSPSLDGLQFPRAAAAWYNWSHVWDLPNTGDSDGELLAEDCREVSAEVAAEFGFEMKNHRNAWSKGESLSLMLLDEDLALFVPAVRLLRRRYSIWFRLIIRGIVYFCASLSLVCFETTGYGMDMESKRFMGSRQAFRKQEFLCVMGRFLCWRWSVVFQRSRVRGKRQKRSMMRPNQSKIQTHVATEDYSMYRSWTASHLQFRTVSYFIYGLKTSESGKWTAIHKIRGLTLTDAFLFAFFQSSHLFG